MRRLVYCLTLLLLSACIDVNDFGAYWNKGGVDDALIGTWKIHQKFGVNDSSMDMTLIITRQKGALHMRAEQGKQEPENYEARAIKIGGAPFLMIKEADAPAAKRSGILQYYSVRDDGDLSFFIPNRTSGSDFTYKGKEISAGDYSLRIGTLNKAAFDEVATMVSTEGAFAEVFRYRKQSK